MENNPQKLAEQIANLFLRHEGEREARDFAALRESVELINERLFKIENTLSSNIPPSAIRTPHLTHPSQEKFEVAEAAPHNQIGAETDDAEKPCPFEPTGKPCDHCSMCSSRGF